MSKKYLIAFGMLAFATVGWADFLKPDLPSKKKPLSISVKSEFFRSHSNYLELGQHKDLPDANFFQYVLFQPKISYSPFRHYINFSLFANSFYASSNSGGKSYNLPFKPSSAGASISFHQKIHSFFIGLELTGAYPLYSDFQNPEEFILGDGAFYGEPALWLLFEPQKGFYFFNRNAFRWRGGGLSSLVFSSLGSVLDSEFISAGLSFDMFMSFPVYDEWTTAPENRHRILESANAGSHKFYSVNPSVFKGHGWFDFKYNFFTATVFCSLDGLGSNYAKGFSVGMMTNFKWNTSSQSSFLDRRRSKKDYFNFRSKRKKTFKREGEKSYFEEEADPYDDDLNEELREELNLLAD